MVATYNTSRTFSPLLIDTAQALGTTPAALLSQQLSTYQMEPIEFGLGTSINTNRNQPTQPTNTSSSKNFSTPLSGAQHLMSVGVPAKGAAWLSGNITQESAWNGQRTWGEVLNDGSDRNGGLVSWMDDADTNHFRLTRIEQHLGKPINQASDSEQIQAMLWEMETYYPSAYRTFMNPMATDRP